MIWVRNRSDERVSEREGTCGCSKQLSICRGEEEGEGREGKGGRGGEGGSGRGGEHEGRIV